MRYLSSRSKAYGCLAASMLMVGSYVALTKPLAIVLPIFLLAWLRFGIGAVAMSGWLRKTEAEAPMTWHTRRLVFLESFFGNFLFTLCMISGVSMTNAVSAGTIMSTIPIVVALLSWILLREKISTRTWGAVVCGVLGIGMLSLSHMEPAAEATDSGQALLGNFLVFCAVVCEAMYAVIGKKLTAVLSPKRISAIINFWGLLLMTPMGLYTALHFHFSSVPVNMWALLVFYGFAASMWSVWLWMTGLQSVPAAHAGVFTVLLPISAALVGVLVLGEKLSFLQLLAFVIALMGMLLVVTPGKATRSVTG